MPGRGKLPVLAEIASPDRGESRVWSLRRADFEALAGVRERLDGHRVVLLTGGEGRIAAATLALAAAASAAGRRTALLDCDLARPRLAAELGLAATPGLHEYLRWEATAPEILQPLVLAGPAAGGAGEALVCVVAGRPAARPATLLESESFRHAIARLGAAYELVVVGGPALDGEAETLSIAAASADALLACVPPEQASGRRHRALRRELRRLPAPVLGAIVVADPPAPR